MTSRPDDPKQFAAERFAQPDHLLSGLDIVVRYATDVPVGLEMLREGFRPEREGARICELGFGSGYLLEEAVSAFPDAHIYGLELSEAMIDHVRSRLGARVTLIRSDMDALPFEDESLDSVATCWTLYFMPDIDATLREIRRVLRPGGKVMAATVAPDHQKELDDVSRAVLARFGGAPIDELSLRFDLESGMEYMERNFPGYEVREWHGEMPLPVEVFVRWWELGHQEYLTGDQREALLSEVRQRALNLAGDDRLVHVRRHDGLFLGRKL
jgi:SAM-dependent methyltransferase